MTDRRVSAVATDHTSAAALIRLTVDGTWLGSLWAPAEADVRAIRDVIQAGGGRWKDERR
jgi:uncharacterized protein (DUF2461 family)